MQMLKLEVKGQQQEQEQEVKEQQQEQGQEFKDQKVKEVWSPNQGS